MKNILHPDLYRLWQEHDLAPERCPDFYRGLREEDRPLVWRFIEQNYLCRPQCQNTSRLLLRSFLIHRVGEEAQILVQGSWLFHSDMGHIPSTGAAYRP